MKSLSILMLVHLLLVCAATSSDNTKNQQLEYRRIQTEKFKRMTEEKLQKQDTTTKTDSTKTLDPFERLQGSWRNARKKILIVKGNKAYFIGSGVYHSIAIKTIENETFFDLNGYRLPVDSDTVLWQHETKEDTQWTRLDDSTTAQICNARENKKWSVSMDKKLKKLREDGETWETIQNVFGKSQNDCVRRELHLKKQRKLWKDEEHYAGRYSPNVNPNENDRNDIERVSRIKAAELNGIPRDVIRNFMNANGLTNAKITSLFEKVDREKNNDIGNNVKNNSSHGNENDNQNNVQDTNITRLAPTGLPVALNTARPGSRPLSHLDDSHEKSNTHSNHDDVNVVVVNENNQDPIQNPANDFNQNNNHDNENELEKDDQQDSTQHSAKQNNDPNRQNNGVEVTNSSNLTLVWILLGVGISVLLIFSFLMIYFLVIKPRRSAQIENKGSQASAQVL